MLTLLDTNGMTILLHSTLLPPAKIFIGQKKIHSIYEETNQEQVNSLYRAKLLTFCGNP